MKNLVNVVHPHTYKMEGDIGNLKLVIGPSEANNDRDEMVVSFLENAKQEGSKILVGFEHVENPIGLAARHMSLKYDPRYKFLTDEKLANFYTSCFGQPIPDERPEKIDEEIWKYLQENIISKSKLEEMSAGFEKIFFIGGIFENCLGNYAHYFSQNYSRNGDKLFCIEDLCVSFDKEEKERIKKELLKDGINFTSYRESLELVKSP